MIGHYVRDKDAVTASMLIAEMAAWYATQGKTLFDALQELFKKYGWYGEKTHNLVMPGVDGVEKMAQLMADLRTNPPQDIAGVKVVAHRDYKSGVETDVLSGETSEMELKGSNVLRYHTEDGTVVIVRPSGTEPKVKVYILTLGADPAERDERLAKYSQWVAGLAK
jgi:phosphoglucomutase